MNHRTASWMISAAALTAWGAAALLLTSAKSPSRPRATSTALDAAVTKTVLPEGDFELGLWTGREGRPVERVRITPAGEVRILGGRLRSGGDIVLAPGRSVVLRATDGPECFRIKVDRLGHLSTEPTRCP